jgi:hypothetical protein
MLGKLNRYFIKVSIFLITAALIAGMVGCGPVTQYSLTISASVGGEITTPGDGTFTYSAGTVVSLNATPIANYQFVSWTGDVGTIADVNAAATTIIMHGNYIITSNFYNPEIRDWYDLNAVRNNLGGNYTLMNDLNSTTPGYEELASPTANGGKGWQPIFKQSVCCAPSRAFYGTFDGQGYEIRDLFINRPDESPVGLFGSIDRGGVIENIGVVNCTVTGNRSSVGGLVGWSYGGTVSNSYSTGSVTGNVNVGGLVGRNEGGNVTNSYSTSSVTGIDNVGGLVGFLIWGGEAEGTVSNSYSTGSVSGNHNVGGLVGFIWPSCTVSNSYATGNVSGPGFVGGLVGQNAGTVSNSYSTSNVTGTSYVGGLVGHGGAASSSFWDIETSGQTYSFGGTGKTTAEMQDIITFLDASWDIITVALNETNSTYIWNIVNNVTYPFLSWQPI